MRTACKGGSPASSTTPCAASPRPALLSPGCVFPSCCVSAGGRGGTPCCGTAATESPRVTSVGWRSLALTSRDGLKKGSDPNELRWQKPSPAEPRRVRRVRKSRAEALSLPVCERGAALRWKQLCVLWELCLGGGSELSCLCVGQKCLLGALLCSRDAALSIVPLIPCGRRALCALIVVQSSAAPPLPSSWLRPSALLGAKGRWERCLLCASASLQALQVRG